MSTLRGVVLASAANFQNHLHGAKRRFRRVGTALQSLFLTPEDHSSLKSAVDVRSVAPGWKDSWMDIWEGVEGR